MSQAGFEEAAEEAIVNEPHLCLCDGSLCASAPPTFPPPRGHFLITEEGVAGETKTLGRDVGTSCLETHSGSCHHQPGGLRGTVGRSCEATRCSKAAAPSGYLLSDPGVVVARPG